MKPRNDFMDWRVWLYGGCILAVVYVLSVLALI
jgi:hypothetical protein